MKIAVITPVQHINGVLDILQTKGDVFLNETASKSEVRDLLLKENIQIIFLS